MLSRLTVGLPLVLVSTMAAQAGGGSAPQQSSGVPDEAGVRYFETHIRPLLAEHCYDCHGADTQESSLRLDTWRGLMMGGDTGRAIVPGKPEQSLLLTAVRYQDPNLQMPPEDRLTARDIEKLARWITMGAPHPSADPSAVMTRPNRDLSTAREFWSFQPPRAALPPAVRDTGWTQTPIDRFILARLEAAGIHPAPPADKQTLLRRTTFSLTGLPPTPEETAAFLADDSPLAFERVVDRLLHSPRYGERWGRHWLDVARYADSNGLDENIHHGNAWRYRDYVVRSLNTDKPYTDFVREQLAGDLLPSANEKQRYEQLIATGFLAVGPKVLAEVDETKMEMDIIDEQLDTVGRSLMGLTFGCARCHDHKFDPILAEDYYGLAGIFKSTRVMEHYKKIARWWENPIPTAADRERTAQHERKLAAAQERIDQLVASANAAVQDSLADGQPLPKNPEARYPDETRAQLKKLRAELDTLKKAPPEVSSAMGAAEREATDLAVHVRGSHLTLGDTVPRRFPVFLAGSDQSALPAQQSGRLELANWVVSEDHPLTARVIVNRIWRWHFGRGLVATPDNFGMLGSRPENQPLLDWLAVWFRENGSSLRKLHRLILLSSTWQLSSDSDPLAELRDPENRLQWRAGVRRLEAEAIRDSILAVSGQLDSTIGGTLLTLKNRSFFFDHTSKDLTDYSSHRRSVYLPVVRNHLYEVFSLFDYSDAGSVVGDRTTSTVAPQALFMMNSEFMQQASEALARRAATDSPSAAESVRRLYWFALSRPPRHDEVAAAESFLREAATLPETRDPLQLLGQVLLSSNEFIYLR